MLKTKDFPKELRIENSNGKRDFDECEHCKYSINDYEKEGLRLRISYYWRYDKILCERCVDKSDNECWWDEESRVRNKLPMFPGRLKRVNGRTN